MDEMVIALFCLAAAVWVVIFTAVRVTASKTAALRTTARQEAAAAQLEAWLAHVEAQEANEPPLPTLSLYEALKLRAEGRLATSSNVSSARRNKVGHESS
jgi:hypothetical protein